MRFVYLAEVFAPHDFHNLVKHKVFASRAAASQWAIDEANLALSVAQKRDPWDGYSFESKVTAIEYEPY